MEALEPETRSQADARRGKARVELIREPCKGLKLMIESKDISGFKALFNTYVYLLETSIQVLSTPDT